VGFWIGPPHIPITLLNIFCFPSHVILVVAEVELTRLSLTLAWQIWPGHL
jgi:hypothetical protein